MDPFKAEIRTVVLYNRRRVRHQTIEAIAKAQNGELIPVEPAELDSFHQISVYLPALEEIRAEYTIPDPKTGRVKQADKK